MQKLKSRWCFNIWELYQKYIYKERVFLTLHSLGVDWYLDMFLDLEKYIGPDLNGTGVALRTRIGDIRLGTVRGVQLKQNEVIINWVRRNKNFCLKLKTRQIKHLTTIDGKMLIKYPAQNLIMGIIIDFKDTYAFSA